MNKITDIKNKGLEFVSFTTEWCPDCVMMRPIIDNLEAWAKEENIDITFYKIDGNGLYQTDDEWSVLKVPSFYIIKDGKREHIGYEYMPITIFQDKIKNAL